MKMKYYLISKGQIVRELQESSVLKYKDLGLVSTMRTNAYRTLVWLVSERR